MPPRRRRRARVRAALTVACVVNRATAASGCACAFLGSRALGRAPLTSTSARRIERAIASQDVKIVRVLARADDATRAAEIFVTFFGHVGARHLFAANAEPVPDLVERALRAASR